MKKSSQMTFLTKDVTRRVCKQCSDYIACVCLPVSLKRDVADEAHQHDVSLQHGPVLGLPSPAETDRHSLRHTAVCEEPTRRVRLDLRPQTDPGRIELLLPVVSVTGGAAGCVQLRWDPRR